MFHHAMIAVDLDSQVPLLDCAPDLLPGASSACRSSIS